MKDIFEIGKKENCSNKLPVDRRLVHQVLNLFFALDMYLQSLKDVETRNTNLQIMYQEPVVEICYQRYIGLSDLLKSKQIFGSKYNLQELITADGLESFFEKLKTKPQNADILLNHEWNLRGINNFHDWFSALAGVLRGE